MKKIFLITLMVAGFGIFSFAQVTKADVTKMLTEIGTSSDKIVKLSVYNTHVFYTDGTHTKTYSTYSAENGEYTNSVGIYDSGIVLKTKKGGVEDSRNLYPYSSISYIEVSKTQLFIYLKN